MSVLAFDGRMGASGDMILAALLAVGANPDALEPVTDALELEYRIDDTVKCGISATTVDVVLTDQDTADREDTDRDHEHSVDDHDHDHSHDGHEHTHANCEHTHNDHEHVRAEGHGPRRSYLEVCDIVESMALEPAVERDALAIFELLGEAEASVHGEALEDIHFHEVGADDAIADIVGAVLLVHDLEPERIVTTPLATGGGSVSMSHGEYPVPTPAVVEIAERADWSLQGGPVEKELLTPTGAAILGHLADGVESLPALEIQSSGYGAGGYDLDPHPNVLRVLVGEGDRGLVKDDIAVLETNVDDVSPEILGGLQETLAEVGARDVSIVPMTMKKSRPGHLVKVICKPEDRQRVARRLAEETGTLGVRESGASHRWIAQREIETVTLEIGGEEYEVDVKIARDVDGEVYDVSAEYEDAKAVAREAKTAIRTVVQQAEEVVYGPLDWN
ncbi:nickel pincer cofactor biosynthesis protein LarC [Salinadaptatus halalkaliphilus]|uniref:Putative nickel insertion protein n=1 Tax=Salinadaptatus halalkaliphilus TaxID=2419781 RepID=A0A4S3TK09_9EURY|nr:nickel pincer cofactor biosynthesis protein LarC [Salinadaptatus halalkaliphilus]THE63583.1 nickel pincer cofactor biosynthesis protein LarC [Salinadaptatus halalkaliphilus]